MNQPTSSQHPSDFIHEVAAQRAELLRKEAADPRRRILAIGIPGSGKTYSICTTMPKVIVLDYDNQLDDVDVRAKVFAHYPMYDADWVKTQLKIVGNPLEILEKVVNALRPGLTPQHTLFTDSMSTFADALKENLEARSLAQPVSDRSFWFWREWSKAWRSLCTLLKSLPCNVAMSAHESEIRDDETGRLQKYGWILQGKEFTPRIPQFFTDVVRQVHNVAADPKTGAITKEEWLWQIKPTADAPHIKSRCRSNSLFIPARWSELVK